MPEPMPMHQMDVLLLNKCKDRVITALHKHGVTEINFLDDEFLNENDVSRDIPLERVSGIARNIIKINRLLGSLKQFDTKKAPFLEDMLGVEIIDKVNVGGKNHDEILKEGTEIISGIEPEVSEIENKFEILTSEESEIVKNIAECKLCPKDVNASDLGEGKFLYAIAGVEGTPGIEGELKKKFKNYLFKSYPIAHEGEEPANCLIIAVMRNKKEELEDILNKYGVRVLDIQGEGKVGEILDKLTARLDKIKTDKKELNKNLEKIYNKYYQKLLVTKELLEIEKERCEAFVSGAATEKTGVLRFWVPENESEKTRKIIKKESNNLCEISVNTDVSDAPVIMNNPKIIKPFEFITTMYGRPKYGNLDPTIFVIPFLILFIGMMVADAVTGIILVALGVFLYRKYGPYSEGVKNLMTLIILCGCMAIIVGVTTGEYFGNLLHHYLLPGTHLPGKIFDPQTTHLYLFLQFAIILGLAHLILGTLLGFYNELRHGKIKEGLTEFFGWSLFGFGLGIVFLSKNVLSDAFMFGSTSVAAIPQVFGDFVTLCIPFFVVGLILSFLKEKFMILIEAIDFFAFTLSYARITALLIAAGAVAAAFNMLAGMAYGGGGIIGIVLGAIVFAVAHMIAMFLAILDGFVQSLRLVYVEHFSRYYTGGGKEFKAFAAERRYTTE